MEKPGWKGKMYFETVNPTIWFPSKIREKPVWGEEKSRASWKMNLKSFWA